jgi:hypothetical protein
MLIDCDIESLWLTSSIQSQISNDNSSIAGGLKLEQLLLVVLVVMVVQ